MAVRIEYRTILDLCGGSGNWSLPYYEAGYDVRIIDKATTGVDILGYTPPDSVYGILAAPPCTVFASSGARWWSNRSETEVLEYVSIVRACLSIINICKPVWWALENPVGRIQKLVPELGKPLYSFQPYQFGDPWTKQTLIWGQHNQPTDYCYVTPLNHLSPHYMSPRFDRVSRRSKTPLGFAKAFFRRNP